MTELHYKPSSVCPQSPTWDGWPLLQPLLVTLPSEPHLSLVAWHENVTSSIKPSAILELVKTPASSPHWDRALQSGWGVSRAAS